jgi:hypothetical protein
MDFLAASLDLFQFASAFAPGVESFIFLSSALNSLRSSCDEGKVKPERRTKQRRGPTHRQMREKDDHMR